MRIPGRDKIQCAGSTLLLPNRTTATRRIFLGAAGATAAATLIGEDDAEANALLWIGGVLLGWAIGKVLDSVWESASASYRRTHAKERRDPAMTPVGSRQYDHGHTCDCRFGKYSTWASPSDDSRIYSFPDPLVASFQKHQVDADHMFENWGAPTSNAFARRLNDGLLGGQRFSQLESRYVVFRTFDSGRDPVFLPCTNRTGSRYHEKARRVVENGEIHLAGERLRNLIEYPSMYKFEQKDRPEYA